MVCTPCCGLVLRSQVPFLSGCQEGIPLGCRSKCTVWCLLALHTMFRWWIHMKGLAKLRAGGKDPKSLDRYGMQAT